MTDLPKCRLCGSEPERCETAQHFYKCSSAACNLYRVALYKNQWRTLMGHSGDAGEMVGRWIKCSERMPDAGVPVLGFGHANESTTVYRTALRWYEYVDDEWIEGVTHWMPLPKPPETGEKCKCCGGTKVFPADHNFACPECDNN